MTRHRGIVLAVLALPAALVVSACGSPISGSGSSAPTGAGSSSSASSSAPTNAGTPAQVPTTSAAPSVASDINPCSLLTKAEADHVAGVTTRPPVRALGLCTFATPTSGAVGQLEVYVGDGAQQYLHIDRDNLKHKFTSVPGLGDESHLEDGAIFVRSGSTWLGLRVTRLDGVDTGPLLKQVAAAAVSRL